MRDHTIDTPIPYFSSLDHLNSHEAKVASLFHSKSVWVLTHVIERRQIGGRILESIYIARDQNGRCISLSFQEVCSISDKLHRKLDKWKTQPDAADMNSAREYKILKIDAVCGFACADLHCGK